MKKIISLLLVISLMLSLCGCGDSDIEAPSDDNETLQTDNGQEQSPDLQTIPAVADWNSDGVLKILTIGNSFSNNTMKYVYEIASDLGVQEIYLGNLYIGGCSLDTHAANARDDKAAYTYYYNRSGVWMSAENYKMGDVIARENWDFISLQQASADSYNPETFGELEYLIGYVKSIANSDATIIWNMTWAYDRSRNSRQNYMYTHIVESVQQKVLTQSDIKVVIPCGTAIQNARTSYVGDNMTGDGMHLNTLGEYIAGLTLVYNLTGLPIENIEFSAGLDNGRKQVAIESVLNASKTPYTVTESVYTEKP